jgi:hypothetical protein
MRGVRGTGWHHDGMRPDNVRSLGCTAVHPRYAWVCDRQRGHDGAHIAADPDHDPGGVHMQMRTQWDDTGETPAPDPMGPLELSAAPVRPVVSTRRTVTDLLLVWLLIMCFLVSPAVIAGAYRIGF